MVEECGRVLSKTYLYLLHCVISIVHLLASPRALFDKHWHSTVTPYHIALAACCGMSAMSNGATERIKFSSYQVLFFSSSLPCSTLSLKKKELLEFFLCTELNIWGKIFVECLH
jgi:hypothetical protein